MKRRKHELRDDIEPGLPACDTDEWPCRHVTCPHCLARYARGDGAGQSWCELVILALPPAARTLDAIGAELGLVRERVRQIEEIALRKLRADRRAAALLELERDAG